MPYFPHPTATLRTLNNYARGKGYAVVAASLTPRPTWNGAGHDIAWEGKVIAVKTADPSGHGYGSLASWTWVARSAGANAAAGEVRIGLSDGSYNRDPDDLPLLLTQVTGPRRWYAPTGPDRSQCRWLPMPAQVIAETWRDSIPWNE